MSKMNNKNQLSNYQVDVSRYTKKDGLTALMFAGIILLIISVGWSLIAIVPGLRDSDGRMMFSGEVFNVIVLVPLYLLALLVFLRRTNQTLSSIGLHLKDWKYNLLVGIIFALLLQMILNGLLPGIIGGWKLQSTTMIVWFVVRAFILAFWEDVVFIGFIQTRIYGLIKKDYIAITVGGIIFAIAHYPPSIIWDIVYYDDAFIRISTILNLVLSTAAWMIIYIFINTVYRRFRSIITLTLFHLSWNLAYQGRLWENASENGLNMFISGSIAFSMIFLVSWVMQRFKKGNKNEE
jgi:membrane protease YdiL (CAAX protease family)